MGMVNSGEVLAVVAFFILIVLAIAIVIAVFYLKNLQDTLKECQESNRTIPPVNVWLMMIPIFNFIYGFIMYPKISETLKNEFESRGHEQPGDYFKMVGLTMPILNLVGLIPVEVIQNISALAGLVIFIIYWVKMAQYKGLLRRLPIAAGNVRFSDNPELLD